MLSITAHKLGGPQGIGALIMRRDRTYRRPPVKQLMYGGQQERGYRPGTTPVALVAGFALAAELCNKEAASHMESCKVIKKSFMEAVQGLNYTLNGDQNYCLPSTINISFHGVDAEGIFLAVKEDYAFSNGSACNSGSHAPSYVLTAMGLDEARISEAVRISWNHNSRNQCFHRRCYGLDCRRNSFRRRNSRFVGGYKAVFSSSFVILLPPSFMFLG